MALNLNQSLDLRLSDQHLYQNTPHTDDDDDDDDKLLGELIHQSSLTATARVNDGKKNASSMIALEDMILGLEPVTPANSLQP